MARRELTIATWGEGRPSIVLLHDGLGSIVQWRGLPAALAAATGRTVLAYDRAGHGRSTPAPGGAWPTDWLHVEAVVLADLLGVLELERPVLMGHSDGGSIALLHAAAGGDIAGVVALAPHSFVEPICVEAIAAMRTAPAPVIAGLARYHADPVAVFEAWSGVWVSDEFRSWDVRARLGSIDVPTLVLQGCDDAYATDAQAIETAAAAGDQATCVLLPDVGHLLHHEDPDAVVDAVSDFVASIPEW